MTVVLFDGKTLAADKASMSRSYFMAPITKIHKVVPTNGEPAFLIGFSGTTVLANSVLEWATAGFPADTMPASQSDPEKFIVAMKIDHERRIWIYENSPKPYLIDRSFHAIGSGQEVALGAMMAGADAVRAVEITNAVIPSCGLGVDSISLNEITQESTS